jgi:hypothetical protein
MTLELERIEFKDMKPGQVLLVSDSGRTYVAVVRGEPVDKTNGGRNENFYVDVEEVTTNERFTIGGWWSAPTCNLLPVHLF